MKITKTFLIVLFLFASILTAGAQTSKEPQYKIVGNEIVKVKKTSVTGAKKTKFVHKVKDSVYTVWQSPKGAFYIWRTSKKTKKAYKQYLKVK